MYKVPWSVYDNQGGWIEVTDRCNMNCIGCYRSNITGDKPINKIYDDIIECQKNTHCDVMVVAGGEPLLYPEIVDVIRFIKLHKMKPLILTNGELLTRELASELKAAGLCRIHFHIDSRQNRIGWEGKNEMDLNALRLKYANILHDLKGIQCGYHVTIDKNNIVQIPAIIKWAMSIRHKVQHISFIAYRSIRTYKNYEFYAGTIKIPEYNLINIIDRSEDNMVSTADMYNILKDHYPEYNPCAYINGTAFHDTNKYLFFASIGSNDQIYGFMGSKAMEISQVIYHLFHHTYLSFVNNPDVGNKIFFLGLFDRYLRIALRKFLSLISRNPSILLKKTYLQSLILQQPIEFIEGEKNVCEHCINPMIYSNKLINPCQLDEFRLFGDSIVAIKPIDNI